MSILTVFVDASHCSTTRASGWGAWAKRNDWDRGSLIGGRFADRMPNAGVAELCGIANALTALKKNDAFDQIELINIQSDCLRALQIIFTLVPGVKKSAKADNAAPVLPMQGKITDVEASAAKVIASLVDGFKVTVKHVKGHSKDKQGRSWVNQQCDRIARGHMKDAREELRVA